MGRLVCVSNRLPSGPNPSGGLVVALKDALEQAGGVWIGSSEELAAAPEDRLVDVNGGSFRRLAFRLTEAEQEGYYSGYSNSVLWPVFHARADLAEIVGEHLAMYRAVNARVARLVASVLEPEDRLWVHDFHFLALAAELRDLGVTNRIGFFLHTPFPAPDDMGTLPNAEEVCGWLSHYDLIGLQGERDVRKCRASLTAVSGAEELQGDRIRVAGRVTRVAAFPIAIDAREFAALAEGEFDKLPPGIVRKDRALLIGVDRLDYTKGLPNRFRAFAEFLHRYEDWHRHVSLLQISPPTREGLKAYDAIREETETLAGRINGAYADITWQPIRYIHRPIPRETLAGLYRAARAALVTPLMDGMNLVAKEYVAAQDPNDPGVLILSQFAGAAEQMDDALMVNPHDMENVSEVIREALTLPLPERRRRHESLMAGLLEKDVHWWSTSFLRALDEGPGG